MRRFFGAAAVAAVALLVVVLTAAAGSGVQSTGFETGTAGWSNYAGSTITQRANGYVNPGGYASGINAADGSFFAGLNRGPCSTDVGGGGDTVNCPGPYTDWGNLNNYTWNGPYTTQVDIYLDTAYANANPDTYGGNLTGLSSTSPYTGDGTNPANIGTRFDFTSAINSSTPDGSGNAQGLRDFGFNVSTGYAGDTCDGFVITGRTNVNRTGANPNGSSDAACIATPGWYTFKHSFSSKSGFLDVLMQIFPKGNSTEVTGAHWDITGIDANGTYGCNRYGWFSDQEIYGLPIDNAKIEGGCAGPVISGPQITETGTTCQAYKAGTATTLGQVLYTLRSGKVNSVSPGVFFYYGTVSGTAGQTVTITQTPNPSTANLIPIQHGQVILYDTRCNALKWTHNDANGVATGTLPSTGTFIISVKYSPADLKGETNPGTVTYTIDGGATIVLAPKT